MTIQWNVHILHIEMDSSNTISYLSHTRHDKTREKKMNKKQTHVSKTVIIDVIGVLVVHNRRKSHKTLNNLTNFIFEYGWLISIISLSGAHFCFVQFFGIKEIPSPNNGISIWIMEMNKTKKKRWYEFICLYVLVYIYIMYALHYFFLILIYFI